MEHLGMEEGATKIFQESLGEFYNSAECYTLQDGNTRIQVAIKRFRDAKGIKWSVLNLWTLKNANFTTNPMERLHREYHALLEFRKFGLNTPEILAVFLSHRMLVTKFVPGKDLSKLESEFLDGLSNDLTPFFEFGRNLATIHNHGFCMGDTKPSNAILSNEDSKIYFTDLEQANTEGNKTWDVAEFIYYSVRFTLKETRVRQLIDSFIQGYLESSQDPGVLRACLSLRYRAPFQAFIAPNIMNVLKKDLQNRTTSAS
jgi:tRNA A-37 threonylcarbamoyl transferase component Bud32